MRKTSSLMLLALVIFSACNNPSFKKGKDGLEYKIITDGSGPKIQYGNYMQLHFSTYYNTGTTDSVLNDSRKQGPPVIELLDSVSTPKAYFEILRQLRKGDSVAIRILTDSAYKKSIEGMPPFFKKGHYITTSLKIVNIFTTRAEADSARAASMAEAQRRDSIDAIAQKVTDDKIIRDYLAKNKINAVKAPQGTYVEVVQAGSGKNMDTTSIMLVNYTGRTLDGKMFDSNTDPSKPVHQPLLVNFTNDMNPNYGTPVITGWKDGMSLLNKGSKAKLFIPSPLGYGKMGAGADIPANAVLMFDVEILDVLTKEQATAITMQRQKEMQELQKHFMDSIQKLKPKPDTIRKTN